MNRLAALGLVGLVVGGVVGFLVGFGVGQATRSRVGESVKTSFTNGTLTVQIQARDAFRLGLEDYFYNR